MVVCLYEQTVGSFALVRVDKKKINIFINLKKFQKTLNYQNLLLLSVEAKTSGFPRSSKLAIAENVVPRSIPITFDIFFNMIS